MTSLPLCATNLSTDSVSKKLNESASLELLRLTVSQPPDVFHAISYVRRLCEFVNGILGDVKRQVATEYCGTPIRFFGQRPWFSFAATATAAAARALRLRVVDTNGAAVQPLPIKFDKFVNSLRGGEFTEPTAFEVSRVAMCKPSDGCNLAAIFRKFLDIVLFKIEVQLPRNTVVHPSGRSDSGRASRCLPPPV